MATEQPTKKDDALAIDLPAPAGWVKKIIPKKSGTPQRGDIVFVSPTGEEIKNKRQLEQYLKAHSGGPAASEFDWATTGDTPRRSARLSEKSKALEELASQPLTKKQKRSSTKRGAKEENDGNADEDAAAAEKTDENTKVVDADMIDVIEGAPPENTIVEDIKNKTETEMHQENLSAEDLKEKTGTLAKDSGKTTEDSDTKLEEPSAPEPPIDANGVSTDPAADLKTEVPDTINDRSKEAHSKTEDPKTASEAPDVDIDESKEGHHLKKETPATTTVDNAEPPATAVNPADSLKEKQTFNNNNSDAVTGSS